MKRILVCGLENYRGGTELVIYNYASNTPKSVASFDFLCYSKPEIFNSLFQEHTNNHYYVIPMKLKHPIKNAIAIRKFFKINAHKYDAIWLNINNVVNIDPLILAKKYGIEQRIVHMHSSRISNDFLVRFFSRLNWKKCRDLATKRWACSKSAGDFLFKNLPYSVVPNLVDAKKFAFSTTKRYTIRKQYELIDRFIIGTVGRLSATKNSKFLIEILPDLLRINPNSVIMFVGEGDIQKDLYNLAVNLGVENHVVFAGTQEDTQAYYSAFDVFALPSLYEGLPLVMLEAQFNGLPCVISTGVSTECVISNAVTRISCNDTNNWVTAMLNARRENVDLIPGLAQKHDLSNAKSETVYLFGDL